MPIPRLTPDSGCRAGGKKHGAAPLRTSACTADLCASRGRITTLFLLLLALLVLLPLAVSVRGGRGRELCHCTQAMIDDSTPHVLEFRLALIGRWNKTATEKEAGGGKSERAVTDTCIGKEQTPPRRHERKFSFR